MFWGTCHFHLEEINFPWRYRHLFAAECWYGTIQFYNSGDNSLSYMCVTNSLFTCMIILLCLVWQQRSQLPAHGYSEEWYGKRAFSTVYPRGCEFKSSGCDTDSTSSSSSSIRFRDACAEPSVGWSQGKFKEVAFSLSKNRSFALTLGIGAAVQAYPSSSCSAVTEDTIMTSWLHIDKYLTLNMSVLFNYGVLE